jgi:glycosyltransferase involved in cell wall biosynthesis
VKVVIEAVGLRTGGAKVLAVNLISALTEFANLELTAVLPDLQETASIPRRNIRIIPAGKHNGLVARHHLLNARIPDLCAKEKADALLCLGNLGPLNSPCPMVIMLHNPYVVYREPLAEREHDLRAKAVTAYGRWYYRHLPAHARIIVQTEVMRKRVTSQYPVATERVHVIPTLPLMPATDQEPVAKEWDPSVFTFLCLAAYCYHKNPRVILDALKILPRYTRKKARCLITISPESCRQARQFLDRIRAEGMSDLMPNLGPVPWAELPRVYRSADALILPTLLEARSFTYQEAMHFGLPILTSDRDFARESCGKAALYFDPLSPVSVAEAMARVMDEPNLRRELVREGRQMLEQSLGWHEIARRFLSVMQTAAGSVPGQVTEDVPVPEVALVE